MVQRFGTSVSLLAASLLVTAGSVLVVRDAHSAEPPPARVQSQLLRTVTVTYDLERSLLFYRDILGQQVIEDAPLDAARSASWLDLGPKAEVRFVVLRGSAEYPGGPIMGGRIAFLGIRDPDRPPEKFRRPNRKGMHGDIVLPHRVQNLDLIYERLSKQGFEILFAPRVTPSRMSRNMMVFDPNGHIVELFELFKPAAPAE